MKKFIGLLTFSLLFFAAKADTLQYRISVGDRHMKWGGGSYIILNTQGLYSDDTLTIAVFSGSNRVAAGGYRLVVSEKRRDIPVYDSIRNGERFTVPLGPIFEHRAKTGEMEYEIYYYAVVGDVKSLRMFCIRLQEGEQ